MSRAKYFAATTDLWTSCSSHPYLSYTVHFIDDDWQLQSFCLDTVPLFEDHTGQNIAEAILDICENWGLSRDNLVATTTDNGTNFITGMAQLECTRISCFGHNLDLAINKSLNITRVQHTIGRCLSCSTEAGRREISPKNRVIWELSNTNLYLQVHISLSLSHTHARTHTLTLIIDTPSIFLMYLPTGCSN